MPDFEKPSGREFRVATETWPEADLELRAEGEGMTFHGYAAVFDSPSEPMPFVERIRQGAFAKTLSGKRDMRMFLNHNSDVLLASTRAGTLRLEEDQKGLRVQADLPDTTAGRDTAELLRRGDIATMSFGFQTVRDAWSEDGKNRELVEVRLYEVSPITGWPAYPATSAFVRHIAAELGEEVEPLEVAFSVLTGEDKLTDDQRELLLRVVNAHIDRPFVGPSLADWQTRLAKKGL
jgi:HK97 family phage prohead protease